MITNEVEVVEGKVGIEDIVLKSQEVFCTGTGASLTPIGSITYQDKKVVFNDGKVGPITQQMYQDLTDIQYERIPDKYNWLHYPWGK